MVVVVAVVVVVVIVVVVVVVVVLAAAAAAATSQKMSNLEKIEQRNRSQSYVFFTEPLHFSNQQWQGHCPNLSRSTEHFGHTLKYEHTKTSIIHYALVEIRIFSDGDGE